jgi:hypothetical protein
LFFLFFATLTNVPAAFLGRLLMGALGDFAAKRRGDLMALRSGEARFAGGG